MTPLKIRRGAVVLVVSILVLTNFLSHVTARAYSKAEKKRAIVGHVLGRVEHLLGPATNSLGGERYDVFVFASSSEAGLARRVAPVKVVYEFYRDEPHLPERFFDFSRTYELWVARDTGCDESVKSLSYEKNVSESGERLPSSLVLRLLDGAPKDILGPDMILPCYELSPGEYREVENKKRR